MKTISMKVIWLILFIVSALACGAGGDNGEPLPTTEYKDYAYVANRNSNNISAYTVDTATGGLTNMAGSPFAAGWEPYSGAVEPGGRYLYISPRHRRTSGY